MITVVLTNYKRLLNLRHIHRRLQQQSVPPKLFLWDNNPSHVSGRLAWDVHAKSRENLFCTPRWHLAKMALTPYVVVMDDDLMPVDREVIGDSARFLETHPDVAAIGMTGVVLKPERTYARCKHIVRGNCPRVDLDVDIIKGRFMAFRTEHLARFAPASTDCEDMEASAFLSNFGRLVIPASFPRRFQNLPVGLHSLAARAEHHDRREEARRRLFRV